jgi:hypothetical protein
MHSPGPATSASPYSKGFFHNINIPVFTLPVWALIGDGVIAIPVTAAGF